MKTSFKRKAIEKLFNEKIDSLVVGLSDDLKQEISDSVIISGGAITSCLHGYIPNDYDIYLNNMSTAKKLAEILIKKCVNSYNSHIKSIDILEHKNQLKFKVLYKDESKKSEYFHSDIKLTLPQSINQLSANSITLGGDLQFITRFIGPVSEIHKSFDFVHTTNYFTKKTGLVLNQHAVESTMTKNLIYIGSQFPICSIFRMKKFLSRGWKISSGEIMKICMDISYVKLYDIETLKEQLIGGNFSQTQKIFEKLKNEHDDRFDRKRLFNVIDEIYSEYELEIKAEKEGNSHDGPSYG